MTVAVRSFAKVNLGLCIGGLRPDGFHELRTVYQTIALHDVLKIQTGKGSGIEIVCDDERVPRDSSNTCYKIAERVLDVLKVTSRVTIEIEKRLPVQGGLGGASGNAVATMIALERALEKSLSGEEKLRIAAEVGSDLPLFLVGGTILGVGRGEEVYPLPDLPSTPCVIALPDVGVSTPRAFGDWDRLQSSETGSKLTGAQPSDRILEFGRTISAWLSTPGTSGKLSSGAPKKVGGRVGNPLLSLVHAGIANDFEQVVFPQYPELREVKKALERAGAWYASLSGSGSAVYGLFRTREQAAGAVRRLGKSGIEARATVTLTRRQYWQRI